MVHILLRPIFSYTVHVQYVLVYRQTIAVVSTYHACAYCTQNPMYHVIADNLETGGSDYYSRRTLHFTLGQKDPLCVQCFAGSDEPSSKRKRQ